MISRKPVPSRAINEADAKTPSGSTNPAIPVPIPASSEARDTPPAYDIALPSPPITGEARPDLDQQLDDLDLDLETSPSPNEPSTSPATPFAAFLPPLRAEKSSSRWKSALTHTLTEARHFAGGLIEHPAESTAHFSILRHSHGLVLYQGPSTNVTLTIFATSPLPADRTLWLQKRGYSGRVGMNLAASTLGSRSAWIDVTPARSVPAEWVRASDERAWKRDIERFEKKRREGKRGGGLGEHKVRETDIVRIPHVAEDGYFRIVLCAGSKVLCPSPVFRYVSASTDPGRLRGASLKTLPLELGIKLGSLVVNQVGGGAASNALSPVTQTVQPYEMDGLTGAAAQGVYAASGVEEKVSARREEADERYEEEMRREVQMLKGQDLAVSESLASEDGPAPPYPVRFTGRVVDYSGTQKEKLGVAKAGLTGVPRDPLLRLSGGYIAWVAVRKPKDIDELLGEADNTWHQALVIVTPGFESHVKVPGQVFVHVYFINYMQDQVVFQAKLDVMIMTLLRPTVHSPIDDCIPELSQTIASVRSVLNRPAWGAEQTLQRTSSKESARSIPERMAKLQKASLKQVDRMQLHRLGVKLETTLTNDHLVGRGGICIPR